MKNLFKIFLLSTLYCVIYTSESNQNNLKKALELEKKSEEQETTNASSNSNPLEMLAGPINTASTNNDYNNKLKRTNAFFRELPNTLQESKNRTSDSDQSNSCSTILNNSSSINIEDQKNN